MLALTILQPFAYAIRHLDKRVENRTWEPPAALIGQRFAIHAGKLTGGCPPKKWLEVRDAINWMGCNDLCRDRLPGPLAHSLVRESGALVAVATLARVVRSSGSPWFVGPLGWELADVVNIEPVPCRGDRKLWRVPDDIAAVVRQRYEAARAAVEAAHV